MPSAQLGVALPGAAPKKRRSPDQDREFSRFDLNTCDARIGASPGSSSASPGSPVPVEEGQDLLGDRRDRLVITDGQLLQTDALTGLDRLGGQPGTPPQPRKSRSSSANGSPRSSRTNAISAATELLPDP